MQEPTNGSISVQTIVDNKSNLIRVNIEPFSTNNEHILGRLLIITTTYIITTKQLESLTVLPDVLVTFDLDKPYLIIN
jgi:hypothetical protein